MPATKTAGIEPASVVLETTVLPLNYALLNRKYRIRTCDLLVPNQALYQTKPISVCHAQARQVSCGTSEQIQSLCRATCGALGSHVRPNTFMDTHGIEPRPVGLQPTARTSYAKCPLLKELQLC